MHSSPFRFAALLVLFVATGLDGDDPMHYLKGPESDPLFLPTQCRVLDDGRVVVLDGARGRLAFFDEHGGFLHYSSLNLVNPVGFCTGLNNTLYVADAENGRLCIYDDRGGFIRQVPVNGGPRPPRLTGVACDRQGGRLYVTDAANHYIHVLTLPGFSRFKTMVLGYSEPDRPPHPLSPLWNDGTLYVVEPLNGRVRCFSEGGEQTGYFGGLGTGPSSLFRPKGIAIDGRGRLFISDSRQGTVSVFDTRTREFLGYVKGGRRTGTTFETPWGLAAGDGDHLFVVEMNRHGALRLDVQELYLPENRAVRIPRRVECFICHPEGGGGGYIGRSAGQPSMCLSCHDGSIFDSRSTVFEDHGHLNGGAAFYALEAASGLPVGDRGELTCITCHQAHGDGDPDGEMETVLFLRFAGPKGKACSRCHLMGEAGLTSHFSGTLKGPLPQELVDMGAAPPAGIPGKIDCRTCHVAHGDGTTRLLVGGAEGPCSACHLEIDHDVEPHFGIKSFRCWDCHGVHGGVGKNLLKEKPGGAKTGCHSCHEKQAVMVGGAHQLQADREPCLVCHTPFTYGEEGTQRRWALDGVHDEESLCLACHGSGGSYSAVNIEVRAHLGECLPIPEGGEIPLTCLTCHDPHSRRKACLEPKVAEKICAGCHGREGLFYFLTFHQ